MQWARAIERCGLFLRFQTTLRVLRTVNLRGVRLDVSSFPRHIKNFFWVGTYERTECELSSRHLVAADRVLELGAAVGFVGLYCRKILGVTHYAGVEPNPETAMLLRRNYRLNGLEPNLIPVALAAEDGEVSLDTHEVFWASSTRDTGSPGKLVQVPALSLDSLLARLSFQPNTLIVDVEGAETLIPFRELPPCIVKLLIELHPQITGRKAAEQLLTDLSAAGFRVVDEENSVYFLARA